jgi:hypothetical protein
MVEVTTEKEKEYYRKAMRKSRGWKCKRCGSNDPSVKLLDSKEKLCERCEILRLKETYRKKEESV